MNEPRDIDETIGSGADTGRTIPDRVTPAQALPGETIEDQATIDESSRRGFDLGTLADDSLEVGLAAAFGGTPGPPRSSLGSGRPVTLREAEGESSLVVAPRSDAMPPASESGDRYHLYGEIARGGMGAILKGRDVDLGRELAVKVLLERHANRPDVAQRFIEEAQIGGQLQHPGVVPVYDIGRFGDRPYFTMKLVKGQTLAAILAERPDPAADRPRLLAIALQAAQAVAYAHAKGVIHRDLKPANIMVGAFGEVQVMDWGLAKVLAEGGVADEERAHQFHQEPADATAIRTARSAGSSGGFGSHTEAGSVLGTPAYMPPEQARGDVATLDRRADVFGLGAILCEILTGKPPYRGRSSEDIRRKAAAGDLADASARLDASGADPDLVGLTRACLAPEPADRPRDAQGVVDALTAYLDGVQERLQAAERERAIASARAIEERKRRRAQLALAGSLAFLVLGGGAVAWWQAEQAATRREVDLRRVLADEHRATADRARLARNAEAVSGLLNQAEAALRGDDVAKAEIALDAARKRSTEGGAETEAKRLDHVEADLSLLRELDLVDQVRWEAIGGKDPDWVAMAARTDSALKRAGIDLDRPSPDDAAIRASASAARPRIIQALDRLLAWENADKVRSVLRKADADPYRDAVRDAVVARDDAKVAQLGEQVDALNQPIGFIASLGENKAIPVDRRRRFLHAAVGRQPADLFLLMALGKSYPRHREEWVDDRIRWFQSAVASAPANPSTFYNLAIALSDKNRLDEAIACYERTIALAPRTAAAFINIGNILSEQGRVDEAIARLEKAVAISPESAPAHMNLGVVLAQAGRADEAMTSFEKAVKFGHNFDQAYYNLGISQLRKGRLDEAIVSLEKAVEIDPKYTSALTALGVVLSRRGRPDEAIARLEKAIEIDPMLAGPHEELGTILYRKGRLNEALARLEKAIEIDLKAANNPRSVLRYNAACMALLVAAGQGGDAGQLDETERTRRRQQALDWLRAHLAIFAGQEQPAEPAALVRFLRQWQQDPDLASIRDAGLLAKLPEAERRTCESLWADVEALIRRIQPSGVSNISPPSR